MAPTGSGHEPKYCSCSANMENLDHVMVPLAASESDSGVSLFVNDYIDGE